MCIHCRSEDYLLADVLFGGFGGRRGRRSMGLFGDPFGFDDGINRNSFAPVSQRAMGELERAKRIFLNHLASVDVSNGSVSEEIITFHLVPDMRKQFNNATSRQLTRAEQDLINKTRKSLMYYTSVTVSDAAQRAYLDKNPHLRKPANTEAAGSSAAPQATSSNFRPLQDASERKMQRQLNEAVINHAASKSTVKRLHQKA